MANGWPDKPGVPVNPEQTRMHWFRCEAGHEFTVVWFMEAGIGWWDRRIGGRGWTYLGPCLTPSEHAAAIAAEREACANVVSDWPIKYDGRPYTVMNIEERDKRIAAAIRARGKLKENESALS